MQSTSEGPRTSQILQVFSLFGEHAAASAKGQGSRTHTGGEPHSPASTPPGLDEGHSENPQNTRGLGSKARRGLPCPPGPVLASSGERCKSHRVGKEARGTWRRLHSTLGGSTPSPHKGIPLPPFLSWEGAEVLAPGCLQRKDLSWQDFPEVLGLRNPSDRTPDPCTKVDPTWLHTPYVSKRPSHQRPGSCLPFTDKNGKKHLPGRPCGQLLRA